VDSRALEGAKQDTQAGRMDEVNIVQIHQQRVASLAVKLNEGLPQCWAGIDVHVAGQVHQADARPPLIHADMQSHAGIIRSNQALPIAVSALIVFSGQFCMTGSRLLVHESVADRVRTGLGAWLRAVKVGPAADPAGEMGPIIDKPNVERIDKIVEDAIAQGATVIVRGGPVADGPLAAGACYRPALLEVRDPSLPIVKDEVFGPVLTMQTFATEAEAVALANDSQYGLSASVFSRDVDLPLRVALALESGSVWVNDWARLDDQFEEGGSKASGLGRMRGFAVMDDFVEFKHIRLRPGPTPAA